MAISSSLPDITRNTDYSKAKKLADNDTGALIAVMGPTGGGKSTFINLVSGSQLRVGHGLRSCTSDIQLSRPFLLDGRYVTLVDTPGFDDTMKSDVEILRMIGGFLADSYEKGKKLSGIIYIYRISDVRMGGVSCRNFSMFRKLCGTDYLENVILVTSRWSEVTSEAGEQREKELKDDPDFWKAVLDKGATTVRHDNTRPNAEEILLRLVSKEPKALLIQQQLVDKHMSIGDTDAGSEFKFALQEQAAKHQNEMRDLRAEMEAAMKERDEMTRNEMSEELQKAEEKLKSVQKSAMSLEKELQDEKRNARALFAKQDAAIAKIAADGERTAENHKAEMDKMAHRHQNLCGILARTQADAQEMSENADLEIEFLMERYDKERKQIETERQDLTDKLDQVEADAAIATMMAKLAQKETEELKTLKDRCDHELMEKEKECEDLGRRIGLMSASLEADESSTNRDYMYTRAKDKGEQMFSWIPGSRRFGRKVGGKIFQAVVD